MVRGLTILLVLSWRTAHALVCRAPATMALRAVPAAAVRMDLAPNHDEKVDKALKAMTGFANSYCKNTGTTYCEDLSIPAVRSSLGAPAAASPHAHTRPRVRPTRTHTHTPAAGGAQRAGGAQGDAGRPTLPVPALRGQGGGGQGRLLELPLCSDAREARLPLHVRRSCHSHTPATPVLLPPCVGVVSCPRTLGTPRLSKARVRGVAQAIPDKGQRVRRRGESCRGRGGEEGHRWYVHPVNGPRCRMHDSLVGTSHRAREPG